MTGYHRKHAIRVLCNEAQTSKARPGPPRRYTDEVRAALITLWEAADRICGKRLKAVIPTLLESMTRYGHLSLSDGLRERLLGISPATIDRLLADVREQAFGGQRKRAGGLATRFAAPFLFGPSPTGMTRRPAIWKSTSSSIAAVSRSTATLFTAW